MNREARRFLSGMSFAMRKSSQRERRRRLDAQESPFVLEDVGGVQCCRPTVVRVLYRDACEPTLLLFVLDLFETVLIQKEVLAGFRQVRSIPILDRIGHRLCTVALWPTLQREPLR